MNNFLEAYPTIIEIAKQLPILGIFVLGNIIAGAYYNISVAGNAIDFKKLALGIEKALIIAFLFMIVALGFDSLGTGVVDVDPKLIMNVAQLMYFGKIVAHLYKILGVEKYVKPTKVENIESGE